MKRLKIMLVIGTMMLIGILMQNKSYGALQSNGGTPATKDVNAWITQIRQMQATGGSLGLTDTINSSNLTSGNKNLDIHMEKNTEYGAVVLLGASSYGNPNKMNTNGVTTTGNKTGVVMNINGERVSAGLTSIGAASIKNASPRYKNMYTAYGDGEVFGDDYTVSNGNLKYQEKKGDAIATVGGWHGATGNRWLTSYRNNGNGAMRSSLLRAYNGSVFSYYGFQNSNGDYNSDAKEADYADPWASRAVVVTGSGV